AAQSQPVAKGISVGQMGKPTASVSGLKHKNPQAVALSMQVCSKGNHLRLSTCLLFPHHTHTYIPLFTVNQEERDRKLADEREKRAAAAERRLTALAVQSGPSTAAGSSTQTTTAANDAACSCCFSSLAGKVPFHRYSYKYCSTTCMHLHSEMLEDD
uniref:Vms1-associating treble clef domain-containing protein n=1 Tax=Aegilops tauschii subsp. strangulata TaxID=200361 RepID=A0A453CL74_AEGTS